MISTAEARSAAKARRPASLAVETSAAMTNYVYRMSNFHDLEMTSITGEQVSFDQYKGNLALVVNVASA